MGKKPRDFNHEYKAYQGKPSQIKRRAQRNAARSKMIKAGKARVGDGKDIDHIMGLSAGNTRKNLRAVSKHKNRSYDRMGPGGRQKRKR